MEARTIPKSNGKSFVLEHQTDAGTSQLGISSIQIPYVNIARQHQFLESKLLEAASRVIRAGDFILGNDVEKFERRVADYCGVRFAVGVNSGTDALTLAMMALGIGPGDEVITVPNSYIATTTSIIATGARPVFVDVRDDYTIDPDKLEDACTPKTKAILPVHLTGCPADLPAILTFARMRNLAVIEDCAQAMGAEINGQRVGSFGDFGCFSMHPLKTLSACGDAGVITLNSRRLYEILLLDRNLGCASRDVVTRWGRNSRLDTLQAAFLMVKFNYFEEWTTKRRANARFYNQHLKDIPEIRLPRWYPNRHSVYHTYIIQAERRDPLKQYLFENGIGTGIHYPTPIHLQPVAQSLGNKNGTFPEAESQAREILSLPIYPELSQAELSTIVDNIKKFYRS